MKYVYILRSITFPNRHYTGITDDLKMRLARHNAKEVPHTSKYPPLAAKDLRGIFEKYLKTASGRAFAKKRL